MENSRRFIEESFPSKRSQRRIGEGKEYSPWAYIYPAYLVGKASFGFIAGNELCGTNPSAERY